MARVAGVDLAVALPRPRLPFRLHLPRWLLNALAWIAIVVVGVFVACLVTVVVAQRNFGWHFDVVVGGSMEPTIHLGSVAIIRDITDPSHLREGDIITYMDPVAQGRLVTHRVIGFTEEGDLRTQGDANGNPDTVPVPLENVRGEYLLSIPKVGFLLHWITSENGYLILIGVPGVLVVSWELATLFANWRGVRRERRKQKRAGPPVGVELLASRLKPQRSRSVDAKGAS
jgi:signal peptidase